MSKSMQGRKLGLRIIQTLTAIAEARGCYKVILDCSKDNIRERHPPGPASDTSIKRHQLTKTAFYEKCGCVKAAQQPVYKIQLMYRFQHKEYEMVRYFDSPAVKTPQTSRL